MGKSARKGKKNKIDFNSFFDSTKPQSEGDGGWHTGVSAMDVLDEGAHALAQQPAAGPGPAAAAVAMDTADYVPMKTGKGKQKGLKIGKGKQNGMKVQQQSLKIMKRGNKTTAQKKRKAAKHEKGMAHAEKTASRTTQQLKKKQQVAALKSLY